MLKFHRSRILRRRSHLSSPQCIPHRYEEKWKIGRMRATAGAHFYHPVCWVGAITKQNCLESHVTLQIALILISMFFIDMARKRKIWRMCGAVVAQLSSPFCRVGDVEKLKFRRSRILRRRLHLSSPHCILHWYGGKWEIWRMRATAVALFYSPVCRVSAITKKNCLGSHVTL